jgi:hypothetical protein
LLYAYLGSDIVSVASINEGMLGLGLLVIYSALYVGRKISVKESPNIGLLN